MRQAEVLALAVLLCGAMACNRRSSGGSPQAKPPVTVCVDVNDDGVADAADEAARLKGQPLFLRWYEPIFAAHGETPEPHFSRADYSQKIIVDVSLADRNATLSAEMDLAERIKFFADEDCTRPLSGTWKLDAAQGGKLVFYLLALPADDQPQERRKAELRLKYSSAAAEYQTALKLVVSGTRFPNPDYFAAARHALAEAAARGKAPVFGDLIFRDSGEPFHVAVMRLRDVRLQVLDATGLASDPVNAWRPNPGVQVANIMEAVKAFPRAVAIINGNYFHIGPMAPGTHIGMYPEGPLMEAGREWHSDPQKWGSNWVSSNGAFAQLKDGSFWYAEGAKSWPPNVQSGVSALKTVDWDTAPHALIGVAAVQGVEERNREELLVLLCGDQSRSGHVSTNDKFNDDLRTMKRSLGLAFMGALDGGGSNALAYRTSEGVLRLIPGTLAVLGRHMKGSQSCINSYLVFHERAKDPAGGAAAGDAPMPAQR